MIKSFVLMQVPLLLENKVLIKLSKINEVTDIQTLFGEYNIMAKIKTKNHENLGKIIINKIKTIDDIEDMKKLTGI